MIYLANPYSGTPSQRQHRAHEAFMATGWLLQSGYRVFSTIVHSHHLSQAFSLPPEADFWMDFNIKMFNACDRLYILCIPGWEDSKGVLMERMWADQTNKPQHYMVPASRCRDNYLITQDYNMVLQVPIYDY